MAYLYYSDQPYKNQYEYAENQTGRKKTQHSYTCIYFHMFDFHKIFVLFLDK